MFVALLTGSDFVSKANIISMSCGVSNCTAASRMLLATSCEECSCLLFLGGQSFLAPSLMPLYILYCRKALWDCILTCVVLAIKNRTFT